MGKYFGTDGIRGKANHTLTIQLATKVGEALYFLDCDEVIVACDTRISSDMLMLAVGAGALSVGKKVKLARVVSTPCLMYNSLISNSIGVMITASHNPYYDNGLKVVKNGYKLLNDEQKLIEDYLEEKITVIKDKVGQLEYVDCETPYLSFLEQFKTKTDLRFIFDTANGATYNLAKRAFDLANKKIINDIPDGYNINEKAGSTHLEGLIGQVKGIYDYGIAFDGDGDRIMIVDKEANIYDGDKLLFVLANSLKAKGMLKKDTVVLTKMSNLGIINCLKEKGIVSEITDVGDKYVLESIMKNDFSLGGENSGHIITPYFNTGDGILVALLIIRILAEGYSLKELTKDIVMYHDKMVNITVSDKTIIQNEGLINLVKKMEDNLGMYGKIILRASGTENLIRISVMSKDEDILREYLDELVDYVKNLVR